MVERAELIVSPELSLASTEIRFTTSRSSGPGGQNVNKVESRVTLLFDLEASSSLTDGQKDRLRERLATRVTRAGILRVVSQKHRTQAANRRAAEERFVELVRAALAQRQPRRATRKPQRAERERLERKRQHAQLKEARRRPPLD
jgi:ribosome-associated protein